MTYNFHGLDNFLRSALNEDIGAYDITTIACIPEDAMIRGEFTAKEDGMICGIEIIERVFHLLDERVYLSPLVMDGAFVKKDSVFAKISGAARAILSGERTALNILQHMSGVTTKTAHFVSQIEGLNTKIRDTRKTTPGMRMLDKYAVKCGGGENHRFGLYDGYLIKDNHIKAAGSIRRAIECIQFAKTETTKNYPIMVETETSAQVVEAINNGADLIMLDNMDLELMSDAVRFIAGRAKTEASGNMDRYDLRKIAETGVDYISIGAITHSVSAMDISLKFE